MLPLNITRIISLMAIQSLILTLKLTSLDKHVVDAQSVSQTNILDASVEYNQNDFYDGEIELNTYLILPALDEHVVDAQSENQTNSNLNFVLITVYNGFSF